MNDTMRTSTRPYIGLVPNAWTDVRLKHVLRAPITDGPHETPEFFNDGFPFLSVDGIQDGRLVFEGCRYVSRADFDEYRSKAAPEVGDLLMGKAASTGKIARLVDPIEFAIWSPLALIKLNQARVDSRFVEYVLKTPALQQQIDDLCNANTQKNIGMGDIPQLAFALPPLGDQERIANFVDDKTARIDALIAAKERLLERLAEFRQTTVSSAVTINDGTPGWRRTRLKFLVKDIIDTEHKTVPFHDDGPYLVARTSNIKKGRLVLEDAKYTDAAGYKEWTARAVPAPGDILFTREAPAGEACLVPDDVPLCLGQRTVLVRLRTNVACPTFVLWSLYGGVSAQFISDLSQGSTVAHFNMPDIGNIPLFTGPIEEQHQKAKALQAQLLRFDHLSAHVVDHISRLREYRSSLISAAVTGQLDISAFKEPVGPASKTIPELATS